MRQQEETENRRCRRRHGRSRRSPRPCARSASTLRFRAGQPFRPHRRRHPDDAEFDEGAARHRRRGAAASGRVLALLASQPRSATAGEVMRELPMPEELCTARRICACTAPICTTRWPRYVPSDIIHLNKKLTGLDQTSGSVTLSFADGTTRDRRCGDRRRRRAFDGARDDRRPGCADPQRPHRLSRACSRPSLMERLRHRAVAHQVVGHRPAHRHLLYDQAEERALLRHQRAGVGELDDQGVVVGQGRRRASCARPMRASMTDVRNVLGCLPGLPQMGDPRARAAADLERGPRRAARRSRRIR